ncbi:MAG: hypothetical protein H5T63_01385, partial [Chloroflexi bacterium]|nr:hypothetical protein [Chloroflexota bacterium]
MDNQSAADRTWRLQKAIVPIIATVALALLTFWVWRQRVILLAPASAPTPAAPTPAPQQWLQLSAPFDGKIHALIVEDPNGVRLLYAGTNGGIFKSEDRGRTWLACNNGLGDRLIRALAIDPDDPNILYAGTWNGKVYVSMNGGNWWEQRSEQLPPYEIRALYVHTFEPNKLYAATPTGVFTSTDRGQHWYPAGDFTSTLQCMAMDLERPDTLSVCTSAYGIYKSRDGAVTWFPLPNNDPIDVSVLVVPPRAPRTAYAISKGKVYKTEEDGNFWRYMDSYRDSAMARCLAVNPKNPQEVYVGVQDGLYKSVDGRKSWFRSDAGLKGQDGNPIDVQVIVVDPIEPNIVYACSDNKLFVSEDAGSTWELRSTIQASSEANILALKADPKDGHTFYASVAGGGLYKTTNGGTKWQHVGEDDPFALIRSFLYITAVEVNPIDPRLVFASTDEGVILKSNDGGMTWTLAGVVTEALVSTLVIDPEQPTRLYAGTQGKGMCRSDDEGQTWVQKGEEIGKNVQRLVLDPRGTETMIYAITEKGVFVSRDHGESWRQ